MEKSDDDANKKHPVSFFTKKLAVKFPYQTCLEAVSTSDFEDKVLKSPLPVLVDFWGPHCAPCLNMVPILDRTARKLEGKVKIVQVNLEENPEFTSDLNINGIPFFVIYRDGKEIATHMGQKSETALMQWITEMALI